MDPILKTISNDLKIKKAFVESFESYFSRIIYSAIGFWALHIALDRKNFQDKFCTKNHVTRALTHLIDRYIELYPQITNYFSKENIETKTIAKEIREIYECTGYICSDGNKIIEYLYSRNLKINNNKILHIGSIGEDISMAGLGVYSNDIGYDIDLNNLFIQKETAKNIFFHLLKKSTFYEFNEKGNTTLLYYDPFSKETKWNSEMRKNIDYTIVQINNTEFGIIKKENSKTVISYLPEIYSKREINVNMRHEINRILLGTKAAYNNNGKVFIYYHEDFFRIKILDFLPNYENCLLNLFGWPMKNAIDRMEFSFPVEFKDIIYKIFNHLSMEMEEN